jgi:hypothetical protein
MDYQVLPETFCGSEMSIIKTATGMFLVLQQEIWSLFVYRKRVYNIAERERH